ncbi:MAG: FecR family protein [Parvularcula sp.]
MTKTTTLKNARISVLALAFGALLAGPIGLAHAQKVGVNAAIKNEVSIQGAEETTSRSAEVGGDVALRDKITSGDNSALQVLLLDETVFTVGPRAELEIDRFVYDPDAGTGEMAAAVARGAFRFMSGRTARKPGAVNIETPVASMGVRGTIVEGAIGREDILAILRDSPLLSGVNLSEMSALIVLRGPAEDHNSSDKDGVVDVRNSTGTTTLTRPGTALLVLGPDQPIIGPFPLPSLGSSLLRDILGTEPSGELEQTVPGVVLPKGIDLDFDTLIEPVIDVEEEQVIDRPTGDCVDAGLPATGGGLMLGGNSGGQVIGDFGSIICQ